MGTGRDHWFLAWGILTPRTVRSKLAGIVDVLLAHYGKQAPPPAATAFELVLWEKVAYLVDDSKRARAFEMLRSRVGLTPQAVIDAHPNLLHECASLGGGVGVPERVLQMRRAAEYVITEWDGNLDTATELPVREAKRALQKIYGIGEPGAEKILLLTRRHKLLGLDSNALRTLLRLGYGSDHKSYTTMYRSVVDAVAPELVDDFDWLISAHVLLRHHGRQICKTTEPYCEMCPLHTRCAYARSRGRSPSELRFPST
jgi:endonuclease III